MADDLADLAGLRAELMNLQAIIANPRTPSGNRKRATRALGQLAIQAVDLCMTKLRDRQQLIADDPV